MKDNKDIIRLIAKINKTKKELEELKKQRNELKNKVKTDSSNENLIAVKYLEHRYKKLEEKSKRLLEESRRLNQTEDYDKSNINSK